MSGEVRTPGIEDIYQLSPMQLGMLFQSLMAPESGVFFEQMATRLPPGFNASAFERAWQMVVERTPALRTSFHWGDLESPVQVVHRRVPVPIEYLDWRGTPAGEISDRLGDYMKSVRQAGFRFDVPPLMRISLIRSPGCDWFVWHFHHLLLDGWSSQLLLRELLEQYTALCLDREYEPPERQPFSAYIDWLQEQDIVVAQQFWRQTLRGIRAPTEIGVGKASSSAWQTRPNEGELVFTLGADSSQSLRHLARTNRLTLNSLIQGAWALMLSRYSGETDVVFGSVVSGRPAELPGVEAMIGLFINTLPVRIAVDRDARFLPWLKDLQARQVEAIQYQYVSTLQIQQWSELPPSTKLFDTVLVFENFPMALPADAGETAADGSFDLGRTDVAITVMVVPGASLRLKFLFDDSRFDAATIRRMAQHLETLLAQVAASPDARLGELSVLSSEERERLLVAWNATARPGYDDHPLMTLLAEQVKRTPDAVVFRDDSGALCLAALDERSSRLSHYLTARGVHPESIVGVCVERSVDAVVAFLAILKTRGVYLPLDSTYPAERLRFMVEDSGAALVLTAGAVPFEPWTPVVDLKRALAEAERCSAACPARPATSGELAYVLYTSGSTGRPKGVTVEYRTILNRLFWMWRAYPFAPGEVSVMRTPLGFVDSFWEMLGPLLQGVPTVIASTAVSRDPRAFVECLAAHGVTRMFLVPSYLEMLLETFPDLGERLPALRSWWSGGEPLSVELARRFRKALPGAVLYNVYGATEIWDGSVFDPTVEVAVTDKIPIGRPLDNSAAYVLDRHRGPVPVGVVGTLHFGGACLARGYVGRASLTGESFLPHPFSDRPGVRLYDTGDLARFRSDGTIEIVGRRDHQISFLGFRIEPAEVETALEEHRAVRESVVVARPTSSGASRLVAYAVAADGSKDSQALLAHVAQRLPSYMVPSAVVWLDAIPRTPSGKRDRRRLPDFQAGSAEGRPTAPTSGLERVLAGHFAAVLDVRAVGVHDHFFRDLGGHSLLATRLVSRLREALGVEVPLRSIFEAPTVALLSNELAPVLGELDVPPQAEPDAPTSPSSPIPCLPRDRSSFPLSFAQERLWFLDQLNPGNPFYNLSSAQRLSFAADPKVLASALTELARRHEALRTVFPIVDGEPVQKILPAEDVPCPVFDLGPFPPLLRETEIQRLVSEIAQAPFHLSSGPLFRTRLIRLGAFDSVFVFVIHHVVADAWSLEIVFRELKELYEAAARKRPASLPDPSLQYADFAVWQRDYLREEVLESQLEYWCRALDGLSTLNLTTDRPRPRVPSYRGSQLETAMTAETVAAVKTLGHDTETTPFMVLVAAFFVLLHRHTGQDDVVIGVPIANRNRAELENVVGFFANSLVLRADLAGNPSFRELLARVRQVALGAYSHQDLPFSKLVAALQPEKDLSRNPLYQVSFQLISGARGGETAAAAKDHALFFDRGTAIFDLVLNLWDSGTRIRGLWEFNTDLFDRFTVDRMLEHYQVLLAGISDAPDEKIGALSLLTESEERQLLIDWNQTAADFPSDSRLHHLFERQAARTPEAVALRQGAMAMTYAELDRSAERLARYLRRQAVGMRRSIGVLLPQSMDEVVAVLAILKSGNAYVPLDTALPRQRLAGMIDDASVEWIVTCSALAHQVADVARAVTIDTAPWDEPAAADVAPRADVEPGDLAYTIFTSGSTGRPKGVRIPHRAVVNYLSWCSRTYPVAEGSGAPLCSPLSSDLSVTSLYLPLLSGKTVTILEDGEMIEALDSALREGWEFSFVKLTPSHLEALNNLSLGRGVARNTRAFIVGGEALHGDTLQPWRDAAPEIGVFNEYGPTEATVGCCVHATRAGDTEPGPVPIGRPIANTRLYVLDRYGSPVAVGVPGELCVGGLGLARGYCGDPEPTGERFVDDPFAAGDERLYKTGDLVRYRHDGTLEFLGRLDRQTKIRGHRVELEDVEVAIRQHPKVLDAAVIGREFGHRDRRLAAFVKLDADQGGPGDSEQLRGFLQRRLPPYMIPSSFTWVRSIPLTQAGKIDTRALEALPSDATRDRAPASAPPSTPLEKVIARVFADVLKADRVAADDDFFAHLDGHSLLATKAVATLRELLKLELPLRMMFDAPTVRSLASALLAESHTTSGIEQTAEVLLEIIDMSDEQVKEQLAAEEQPATESRRDGFASYGGNPGHSPEEQS